MILDGNARRKFKPLKERERRIDLIFFEILTIEISIRIKGGHLCPRNWNVPFVMPTSLLKETSNLGILSYVPIARYPLK
jgi:hypothetical protein